MRGWEVLDEQADGAALEELALPPFDIIFLFCARCSSHCFFSAAPHSKTCLADIAGADAATKPPVDEIDLMVHAQ